MAIQLFVQHSQAFFSLRWFPYGWQELGLCPIQVPAPRPRIGNGQDGPIRVWRGQSILVPAGSLRPVLAVCHQWLGSTLSSALLEVLLENGSRPCYSFSFPPHGSGDGQFALLSAIKTHAFGPDPYEWVVSNLYLVVLCKCLIYCYYCILDIKVAHVIVDVAIVFLFYVWLVLIL